MNLEKLLKSTKLASVLAVSCISANGSAFVSHGNSQQILPGSNIYVEDSSENLIGLTGDFNGDGLRDVAISGRGGNIAFIHYADTDSDFEDLSVSNSAAIWFDYEPNNKQSVYFWNGSSVKTFPIGTETERNNPNVELDLKVLGVSDDGYFYGYRIEDFSEDTENDILVAKINGADIVQELDYLGRQAAMVNDKVYFIGSKEDGYNDTLSELDEHGIIKVITSTSEDISVDDMISSGGHLYFAQNLNFESPLADHIIIKRYNGREMQNMYLMKEGQYEGIYESSDGVVFGIDGNTSSESGYFHLSDTRGLSKLIDGGSRGSVVSFYNQSLLRTDPSGFKSESFQLTPIVLPEVSFVYEGFNGYYHNVELAISGLQQGKFYKIESSSDLKNWVEEDTFWNDRGIVFDRESYSSTAANRFYRVNVENNEIRPPSDVVVVE